MSLTADQLDVRILSARVVATDIVALELAPVDGGALPPFEAGAHVDVHVAPGLVRQYSLCNDPSETHRYRLGILRDAASRGGSQGIHDHFVAGQVISISVPRCNFRLMPSARHSILLGGGIGITPLIAMAYRLQAQGADFALHYCTRSPDRTAFADELAASGFAARVQLHHDDGPAAQRLDLDRDLPVRQVDTHLYICGPAGFIKFVGDGARQRGWTDEQIHIEHFGAVTSQAGSAFTVLAASSGVTVRVEDGQTIAQVLAAAGVDVPLSCEQGVCGTCLTRVIEGTPEHRDLYQTDAEKAANTHMTPCCSRSLSPHLVLEI